MSVHPGNIARTTIVAINRIIQTSPRLSGFALDLQRPPPVSPGGGLALSLAHSQRAAHGFFQAEITSFKARRAISGAEA
jgi:hypothetical protein